ncbi:alpha/beta-hydrolase [Rhizodiscina lignyota]|uniref:Carboxylic ester hydrolase n=1 Tax=Rhizodiscina lignyota TaxID=1504668 RepID=A0A9P4M9K1_9PEZI|nr:alpha/beta-hydrolase [Rhizodiscina lignyota]
MLLSFRLLAACFLSRTLASPIAPYGENLVVDLGYGRFQGVKNETAGVTTWFGIRYAAPPTGSKRWQPPQDIESTHYYTPGKVVDATHQGPICVQGTPAWQLNNTSNVTTPVGAEDCLLLDVLVPANPTSPKLAVIAQIHGGGYTEGNSETYPGYALVNASRGNVIYATLQYRLGAYGFLSSDEIKQNGAPNAGLLDQRAALYWIQRHIGSFGGDPEKVTIYGGSAGGGSVMDQMILYGGAADPPFRAAIAERPWWQPYHDDAALERQYDELLQASDCHDLQCLRSLPADELALATQTSYILGYTAKNYGYGDFYYGPTVDGTVVRDLPSNEYKQGHFTKVPLITDREGFEGYTFSNLSESTAAEETADLESLFPGWTPSFLKRLYSLYPRSDFNSTFFQRQTIFGDFIISCPTYYMATAVSDYKPTYKMIFDAGTEMHGATQPYLLAFGYGNVTGQNGTLAHIMKDYYVSFVTHLDPNVVSYSGTPKPAWPSYQSGNGESFEVMFVNYTMMGATEDFDEGPRCDFWHSESYITRN